MRLYSCVWRILGISGSHDMYGLSDRPIFLRYLSYRHGVVNHSLDMILVTEVYVVYISSIVYIIRRQHRVFVRLCFLLVQRLRLLS